MQILVELVTHWIEEDVIKVVIVDHGVSVLNPFLIAATPNDDDDEELRIFPHNNLNICEVRFGGNKIQEGHENGNITVMARSEVGWEQW